VRNKVQFAIPIIYSEAVLAPNSTQSVTEAFLAPYREITDVNYF
jgi:hypothetical protein